MSTLTTDQSIQLAKLEKVVSHAFNNSSFYKKHLASSYSSEDKLDLEQYKSFPFTTKEDLAQNNEGFLCVDKKQIAEYVTTSGTTGDPISLYLTKNDLERLAKNEYDSLTLMGNSSDDLFQLLTTIDKQFMAGLAYFLGVQKLGAGMIRIGPGVPHLQWNSILKYKPTKLIAVPSFIVALIDYAKENNIDFQNSSVEAIVCIGEPIRNDNLSYNVLGRRITDDWDVKIFSTYASTEMGAAFSECTEQKGCHLNEDLLFMEVLKEDGTEAQDQESGEIVVSTLGVEGSPVIRYKTGDIAKVYRTPCSCGRTSPRLGPIIGRKNQMIKYKGTTIYPKAIFEIMESFKEITCFKILVEKDDLENDEIVVLLEEKIERNTEVFAGIKNQCKAKLRVLPKFKFLSSEELRSMVYRKDMRKPEKIRFSQ